LNNNPDIKKAFENIKDTKLQDEMLVLYDKDTID
jgi:hypothetical protein